MALMVALRGDAVQMLHPEEQEGYDWLLKRLEMQYGQAHLEEVY